MTVWVVHPVKDDLSAAAQYGPIKYITDGYVYPDELEKLTSTEPPYLPANVLTLLARAADNFNPYADDYLLLAGDHLQLVQFVAVLSVMCATSGFNVLRYDREAKGYLPVHIQPA